MNEKTSFPDQVQLGRTHMSISVVGLGTWAWGDRLMWGYGKGFGDDDIRQAFEASVAAGINFLDTAEIYGRGRSESLVGRLIHLCNTPLVVATKCFPYPYRVSARWLSKALNKSLKRLHMEQVHLYQMHWPFPPVSIESWMNAMADAVEAGLVRAVGVSNYNLEQTQRAVAALARRGLALASNQVSYSLLYRQPEQSGLLDYCREQGVTLIAYSPLAQGLLTGKYSPQSRPPGLRRLRFRRNMLERVQPLIALMREIGEGHGGKTPAQVALNWVICKGAIPIPGAKNAHQAEQNAGAMGWRLSSEEVAALDKAASF
ncbi:MAG: aldo/keto reductase [Chloroflexi bacterium]|nr:aldo/keto reductase [Chloroflexota bacterium]